MVVEYSIRSDNMHIAYLSTIWREDDVEMFTLTGTVGADGKYLVTGMPVNTNTHTVLKLAFENNTAGTNLSLCAGTDADFTAGTAGTRLSDSRGPGSNS
jgi:hypothetical protein